MREHPPRRRVNMVGCGLTMGMICLVFGLLVAWVAAANVRTARAPEPPFPEGVPRDVPVLYGTAMVGQDDYLAPSGEPVEIMVEFAEVESFQGLWTGEDPRLAVRAPYGQSLEAVTHVDEWRDLVVGQGPGNEFWTPWVRATLVATEARRHQWLTIDAGVDVTYPVATGLEVADTSARLNRTVRLFVISPAELAQVEAHVRWEDARDDSPVETAAFVLCPGVLLVGAVAAFAVALQAYRIKREDGE